VISPGFSRELGSRFRTAHIPEAGLATNEGTIFGGLFFPGIPVVVAHGVDLPVLTGPGSELVYAASWFMGNRSRSGLDLRPPQEIAVTGR